MSDIAIRVENLSKQYRLGEVGTGTLSHDLNRWWHRVRGKEDPYLKIGETNDRSTKGKTEYVWALKDINFEVQQGEVLGIIGKNGAGKSTLLKILSKVTGPTTGSIKAKGRIASLLEVGTGFHPELTGRENIYLNGTILGMTRTEVSRKLDEIVAFAGVERYLDTPVKRYSSGMMVRLGFAVAAHLEPEILIVDEVLAVGDAEFQKKAVGKMQEVSTQGGRTVLFVSHNMGSVRNLCGDSLLLSKGGIELKGKTHEVVNYYLNHNKNFDCGFKNSLLYQKYSSYITIEDIVYDRGRINIELNSSQKHKRIAIVCKIFSVDGVLLFKTSTSPIWSTNTFEIHGRERFNLDVSKINLIPGKYNLGIEVTIPDVKCLLSIDNALTIQIENKKIYQGTKELKSGEDGYLVLHHNWSRENSN